MISPGIFHEANRNLIYGLAQPSGSSGVAATEPPTPDREVETSSRQPKIPKTNGRPGEAAASLALKRSSTGIPGKNTVFQRFHRGKKGKAGPERRWRHTGVFQLPPEVLAVAEADSGAEGWIPSGTLSVLLQSRASTEMPSATISHLPCLINSLLMQEMELWSS